jgi:hypothetical protein
MVNGKSFIDQSLCIKCGRLHAGLSVQRRFLYRERPCAARRCGVNAIGSDAEGFAEIDYDK